MKMYNKNLSMFYAIYCINDFQPLVVILDNMV